MSPVKLMVGALGLLAAVGCGSSVNDDDENPGSGGSGTGASGSGGGTGGNAQCDAFRDEQGSAEVVIRFRNDSPQDIYLQGNCASVQYGIRPSAGDDGTAYSFDRSCLQTCEGHQDEPPLPCAAGACAASSWHLPPGGTHEVTWDGTGLRQENMPAECYYEGESFGGTCGQVIAAEPNTYRVEVNGFGQCESYTDAPECECDATGQCWGAATGAEAWADVTEFAHPSTPVVEVVFGSCAFGCPEG